MIYYFDSLIDVTEGEGNLYECASSKQRPIAIAIHYRDNSFTPPAVTSRKYRRSKFRQGLERK